MKRVLSFLIAVCIIIGTLTALCALPAAAESIKPKKVISIVYDDSGSMFDENDTWEYASYGIQTFAGLLGDDDVLFVTYMSDETRYNICDVSDRQNTIDTIRNHSDSSATPAGSIITANNALIDYFNTSGDKDTEYWLIIFTDGDLNDADSVEDVVSDAYKQDEQLGFKLNNFYFPLGQYAELRNPQLDEVNVYDKNSDGTPDKIETGDEFIEALGAEADLISGRMRINDSDIKLNGDNVLSFSSKLPLYSIEILSQKSSAIVTSAGYTGGELKIASSVSLQAPDKLSDVLAGTATMINNGTENIPASEYTIEFADKIDLDSIVVMVEPAVGIKLTVTRDGNEVDENSDFTQDDLLDLTGTIVEAGTDTPLDMSLLPTGTTFETGYITASDSQSDNALSFSGCKLTLEETELYTSIILPGFLPIKASVTITPEELPLYTIVADSDRYRVTQSNLRHKDADPLTFKVYLDGVQLTYEEVEKLPYRIETNYVLWNNWQMTGKTELLPDGSIAFTPEYNHWITAYLFSLYTLPLGNGVKAVIGKSESEKVPVTFGLAFPIDYLINLFQLLVYLYIIHTLVKKKFPLPGKKRLMLTTINYTKTSNTRINDTVGGEEMTLRNFPQMLIPIRKIHYTEDYVTVYPEGFLREAVKFIRMDEDGIFYYEEEMCDDPAQLNEDINTAKVGVYSSDEDEGDSSGSEKTKSKTVQVGRAYYRISPETSSLTEYAVGRQSDNNGNNDNDYLGDESGDNDF